MRGEHRLPQLSTLRAFEATVRHESVTRAAHELNVTDGAVSKAVRDLEAELGFALFRRGHRSIEPTSGARSLAHDVRGALDHLRAAMARIRNAPRRALVLSCEPTFLIRWLIPRLRGLQDALGEGREVRFVSAGGPVPFARDGIDLALRRADFPIADDILAEPFFDERIGPVCRPELAAALAGTGPIDAVLLHTATRPDAWASWAKLTGAALSPARDVVLEHFYLSLQAAVAGAGVAIGPLALVADDLRAGSLLAPRGFVPDGTRYVLMAPLGRVERETFGAMLAWLRAETAAAAELASTQV